VDVATKNFLEKLRSLELPEGDFAIFGSGPMLNYNLKQSSHDIDVVARGAAWKKAMTLGEVSQAAMGDHVVRLFDDAIEIFDGWKPGKWNINKLIDEAEKHHGLPWVRLEEVLKWKKRMGRVKDFEEIPKIERFLKSLHE
jgi:hypothetical protein